MLLVARGEAMAAPVFERFERQRAAQQALAERLKYSSPAILSQLAMSELADTGSSVYARFNAQVESYHQRFRDYFYSRTMSGELMTRAEVAGIPRFYYVPEADGSVVARVLGSLASLVLYAGGVLLAGFAYLKCYPAAGR